MSAQRCFYCGRENQVDNANCSGCGSDLVPPHELRCVLSLRRWRRVALAAILALSVLVLAIVFYSARRPKQVDALEIRGTAAFKEQVANSLILLRSRAPESYGIVTTFIGRISQAKHSGMAAYEIPPTLELNDRTAFYSVTWCAGSIAHDSIHSKLYNDFRKLHPAGAYAPDDVWTGEEAERQCCAQQTRALLQLGAPASEVNSVSQTNIRYWEIDYTKRDW